MITSTKRSLEDDSLTMIRLEFNNEKDINLLRDIVQLAEQQAQHYSEFSTGLPEMITSIKNSL